MRFHEQLSSYLDQIGATHKELAEASALSAATISRYCSGEREPVYQSDAVGQLAGALTELARKKGHALPPRDEILRSLNDAVQNRLDVDYDVFLANLNRLLGDLGVRISELARGIFSDASHISKILSGSRRPGNVNNFIREVSSYIARRFAGSNDLSAIAKLTETEANALSSVPALQEKISSWLGSSAAAAPDDSIPRFLSQVDEFDLGKYLKAVRFDAIKVPPALPQLPTRKEYTGIRQMMESELDFMKTTVLSRRTDPCILYSDMPLEEMAADPDFPKKYMFGMALMLKKGLHLHIIHDINRPFAEMMLGLESWIPLYMTGQISPYYLPLSQSKVFLHFLKVSGAAALEGTAIADNQGSGKYVLYRSREDVKHYRIRAAQLLEKALPLMDIYRDDEKKYASLLQQIWADGDRKMICSNLPAYFLPEERLLAILDAAAPGKPLRKKILSYYREMRETMRALLKENCIHLVVPGADPARFGEAPVGLSLADLLLTEQIPLSYDSYTACLQDLRALAETEPNFTLEEDPAPAFHNINILILGERLVVVSKEKSPVIHFVIHHKKMIRAFQNFVPPLVEQ